MSGVEDLCVESTFEMLCCPFLFLISLSRGLWLSHVSDFVSYTPHSSTTLRTCWGGLNTNSLTETFQNPDVIPNTSHCNVDTLLMFYCLSSTGLCFVTGHCHCIKAEHGRYWASTSAQEDYKMSSSLSGIQKNNIMCGWTYVQLKRSVDL